MRFSSYLFLLSYSYISIQSYIEGRKKNSQASVGHRVPGMSDADRCYFSSQRGHLPASTEPYIAWTKDRLAIYRPLEAIAYISMRSNYRYTYHSVHPINFLLDAPLAHRRRMKSLPSSLSRAMLDLYTRLRRFEQPTDGGSTILYKKQYRPKMADGCNSVYSYVCTLHNAS